MGTSVTPDYPRGLSFEQVWATIHVNAQAAAEALAESKKVADQQMQELRESQKETERLIKELRESQKETDRQMKKTDEKLEKLGINLGGLNNSMGELIEIIIAARLWEKFAQYPYKLRRGYRRVYVYDDDNRARTEIDILLSDTDVIMAVEVKDEPKNGDVDYHINRMRLIRKYPPAEAKGKKLLGAIAGASVSPDVQAYAHNAGFFVLELTGESVALIPPPEGFVVPEW